MKRALCFVLILSLFFSTILPINSFADEIEFRRLSDPELLPYLEESLYESLVTDLNSDEFFVENVEAVYLSDEYIETLAYNSRENIYFGYTLSELDAQFSGQRYIFTLGENNETIVEAVKNYDNSYVNTIIRNVSIGTGVILICVTVSVLTAGTASTAAASMIFAVAAKTGTEAALAGAAFGGITSGIVTGYTTGNMDEALKSAAIGASEGFKWGAISGAITGGAMEGFGLRGATLNGLTMNDAARIQRETKLPLAFIKNFHSYEEYEIYKAAGLSAEKIGDTLAFTKAIDLDSVITDQYGNTMTNTERILKGSSPVDPNGIPYELHHIGQQPDSPLAILTKSEHMQGGHNKILHFRAESSVNHDAAWNKQVANFWHSYLERYGAL